MSSLRTDVTPAAIARAGPLRVSTRHCDGSGVVIVEGRLAEVTLPLVDAACQEIRAAGLRLVVDLEGLRWLDPAAADALRAIAASGGELRNLSRYVSALLEASPYWPL
jgi:hypothetical protein